MAATATQALIMDLRCESVETMAARLIADGIMGDFFEADPPWKFTGGTKSKQRGLSARHYGGLPELVIARHLALTGKLAKPRSYLAMWITPAKIWDWFRLDVPPEPSDYHKRDAWLNQVIQAVLAYPPRQLTDAGWIGITGAGWGKLRSFGVGTHVRGDFEPVLIWKRDHTLPKDKGVSSLTLTASGFEDWIDGCHNLWLVPRLGHSEKPQPALRSLLQMGTNTLDTVINFYAGEFGSMARAARAMRCHYHGAEIDPVRWQSSLDYYSQGEIPNSGWLTR